MTRYSDTISGITQRDLCELGRANDTGPYKKAWLVLHDGGELSYDTSYATGCDGIPAPVWHGQWVRWEVEPCTNIAVLRDALEDGGELAALIDRVSAGHSVAWDGRNHVGSLADDADEASRRIKDFLDCIHRVDLCRWRAADWLARSLDQTRREVRSRMAAGETLDVIAESMVAEGEAHDALLDVDDVRYYIADLVASDGEEETREYVAESWLRFGVPARSQGQIVVRSYATDLQSMVVVERSIDTSDGSESYRIADLDDDDLEWAQNYDAGGAAEPPPVAVDRWECVNFIPAE